MPKILIANADNQRMVADPRFLSEKFCRESAMASCKMAWLAAPGDIVILPRRVSPDMERYIAKVMGHAEGSVRYVTPDWRQQKPQPLSAGALVHLGLADEVARHIHDHAWTVHPYIYERGIPVFLDYLKLRQQCDLAFMNNGGAELLNDKPAFRSLAAARGIPIARGDVCMSATELSDAFRRLVPETGAVIVKQDRNASAEGNLIVTRDENIGTQGAFSVIVAGETTDIADTAAIVWSRLAYHETAPLLVEVYHPVSAILYAEFLVSAQTNSVKLLNWGEQRMEPTFRGFVIPGNLPPYQASRFIAGTTELARLAVDLGFDGLMDVDGIITTGGEIVYNEINGRTGGCSHIHHILTTLRDSDYGDEVVVTAHDNISSIPFERVLGLLDTRGLGYDRGTGSGIIVTAEDTERLKVIDYIAIAATRQEALAMEAEFEKMVNPKASVDE
jgi:hypothetical protein